MVQGTVVTFWCRALEGTTLAQLHRDWAFGLHVWKALAAGRNFNILAIACICVTFVAVDGPLIQRASFVQSQVPRKPQSLRLSISPEIPAYSTGAAVLDLSAKDAVQYQPVEDFLPVLTGYLSGRAMTSPNSGCRGKCESILKERKVSYCCDLTCDVSLPRIVQI